MLTEKNDKNIIGNAMIVLFLSLLIVYVIRYQTGWSNRQTTRPDTNPSTITDTLVINPIQWTNTDTIMTMTDTEQTQTGTQNIQDNQWWQITEEELVSVETIEEDTQDATTEIPNNTMKVLSGTTLYFWPIEWIDKLGISYAYALRDDRNIYFVRLENEPNLSAIARSLWWTLYTMNTETEIMRNELFGNRITFINIPIYRDNKVLMYVEVWQEKRLLQIPFNIYHQSKSYLQNLFIN